MVPTGDAVWRRAGQARTLRAFGQWEAAHPARARTTEGSDAMTRLSDTQSCLLSSAAWKRGWVHCSRQMPSSHGCM